MLKREVFYVIIFYVSENIIPTSILVESNLCWNVQSSMGEYSMYLEEGWRTSGLLIQYK